MPKLFVGIIAVSLFATALGAYFLWDDLFGEQDTEVYYEITKVEPKSYMGLPYRDIYVHFSEPIGYKNDVIMKSKVTHSYASITWYGDDKGWAMLELPSEEVEIPITEDIYFSCDGFKFIPKS